MGNEPMYGRCTRCGGNLTAGHTCSLFGIQEHADRATHDPSDEPPVMGAGDMTRNWEEIMASIDRATALRKELMPTEESALRLMLHVSERLKEFGWQNAIYAPKDGRPLELIEFGSSGIHKGHCREVPPSDFPMKWFWILDDDMWPSKPILYREPKEKP